MTIGDPAALQVAQLTLDHMAAGGMYDHLSGGFARYSVDEEGTFYIWTEAGMSEVLENDEMAAARDWYGVTADGNFEGANVLHRPTVGELLRPELVEAARAKLEAAREHRQRPGLDNKVLTEWNALMISALAEAGAAAGVEAWVDAAAQAMGFLEKHLVGDGRWYRSWQETGGRRHLAYAADYAAPIDAYTRLGEATGQSRWHLSALSTAEAMLNLFWDD